MKYLLFLLTFIHLTAFAADKYQIKMFQKDRKMVMSHYLGHNEKEIYFIRITANKNFSVFAYDLKTMAFLRQTKYEFQGIGKSSLFLFKVQLIGDEIVFLYSIEDHKEGKEVLIRNTYSLSNPKSNAKSKVLCKYPLKHPNISYEIVESDNRDFTLLTVVISGRNEKENGVYAIVLDKNLELYWSKDFILDDVSGYLSIGDIFVDNKGHAEYVIYQFKNSADFQQQESFKYVFRDRYKRLNSLPKLSTKIDVKKQVYSTLVLHINNQGKSDVVELTGKDYFIKQSTIFNYGDDVFVAGIISKQGDLNNAGVFVEKINDFSQSKIEVNNIFLFSDAFHLNGILPFDSVHYHNASKNNGLWEYHNHGNIGMLPFDDGYLFLINQDYRVNIIGSTNVSYMFEDYVYAIKTDKTGKIEKTIRIVLDQIILKSPYIFSAHINNFDDRVCSFTVKNDELILLSEKISNKATDSIFVQRFNNNLELVERKTLNHKYKAVAVFDNTWIDDNTTLISLISYDSPERYFLFEFN